MDTVYHADKAWLLDIQRRLYSWSRTNPDDAWRDMWNWVTQPQNLRLAWRRVASNRGARSSGVDRVTVKHIETRIGVTNFLTATRATLRDRVVQAAVLQLLEPILEAEFLPVSYGFRPCRACRDALEHIRAAIRPASQKSKADRPHPPYQWVIEGDIKGCFDNIDHHHVMTRLRRRVADVQVTRLVLAFLKAGILSEGAFFRTDAGTPQGGILSPLLANITLACIEERYARYVSPRLTRDGKPYARPGDAIRKFRHYERKAGRTVFLPIRYADDFVVLVSGSEEQARVEKDSLAAFLGAEMKLTLSPEKTHVTPLTEGFQFLGHRVRLRWDDRWGYWPRVEIPQAKLKDFRHRIKQHTTRGLSHISFQELIDALNPVLLGWGRFYQHCYGAKQVFARVDHYVWDRLRRWLRKKYPKTPRLAVRRRYWRRLPGRARYRWVDQRPVAIVADLKVGRHDLRKMRMPDYARTVTESPVHTERCTPGSGTGTGETGGGNPASGASVPRSLKNQRGTV